MAETPATPGDQGTPQPGAQPGNPGEGMIPKPRFDEVNERMKAAERKLSELAAAEDARQKADLEAKGEYEKLKTRLEQERDSFKADAESWRSYHASRRETLLAGLPDEHKPIANDLPLDKLEQYVGLHKKTDPAPPPPPPTPPGVPGAAASVGALTEDQLREGFAQKGAAFWSELAQRNG